jgi:hypothetical protein
VGRLGKMAGSFAAGVVHGGASKLSDDGYTNLFFEPKLVLGIKL